MPAAAPLDRAEKEKRSEGRRGGAGDGRNRESEKPPPRRTGRRPNRSATGPPKIGARAKPMKKKLRVSAPRPGAAWKLLSMAGTPGRFMSMERAGSAESAPRKAVNPDECGLTITEAQWCKGPGALELSFGEHSRIGPLVRRPVRHSALLWPTSAASQTIRIVS